MKTIQVKIEGISPLLINRFQEVSENPATMKKSNKKDYGTPRLQAEKTAYKDDKDFLWIPSTWLKGAISHVSSDYKLPSSRKSVKSIIGGALIPIDEVIYFNEKYKLKDLEIDSRPCVIQRARIMRHRARLEKWSLTFRFELEEDLISPANLNEMITDSGRRSGIGDFRPQKGGPFGRFVVSEFKEI